MKTGKTATLFIFLVVLVIASLSCTTTGDIDTERAKALKSVEIREYQGEKLSSVLGFRENSIRGAQYVNIDDYQLEITGLVETPVTYSYDDVINNYQHYQKVVTLNCVEGWSVTILWEGILLKDLIAEADPLSEAKVIIFHAYDSYTTSHPLDYLMDNDIIMAYRINGVTIPLERGFPFQLVAESKWGYKWIKWITKIELSDDVDYRGFWESRGYSNSAKLDEDFFE
jgi:DMSO/TMAO reductase YedYZ molybdopterin-dependent catalytic subunit